MIDCFKHFLFNLSTTFRISTLNLSSVSWKSQICLRIDQLANFRLKFLHKIKNPHKIKPEFNL